jgi:arylsulfatase A-like enzyme
MTKNFFLEVVLVLVLLSTFSCSSTGDNQINSNPNILIFIADDAGVNDVGYNGSEIATPNMDRLAQEGVILGQHYVYPTCSPTRAALLTGRPPSRFGILGPLQSDSKTRFAEGTLMLSSVLKKAGYETCLDGKWHLGMTPDQYPHHFGFDHTYGYVGPWIDSYTHLVGNFRGDGSGIRQWQRNGELFEEHGHVTDLITAEAIDFITSRRDKSKPFFLYVAYSAPHVPCQEPKKYTNPYEGVIENNSRLFFAASMTHLDESMGEIVGTLKEEGIENNTLVIFMSDNGGQKGADFGATGSGWLIPPDEYNMAYALSDQLGDNASLRSWKGTVYEGGIRVPAFVSWPGHLKPARIEEPIHVCDWLPTLAGLAGIGVPGEMHVEGMDVLPILLGRELGTPRYLYWRGSRQQAVRKGPWKLIHSAKNNEREPGREAS